MHYIGIDVHEKKSVLQHLDDEGFLGLTTEIPTTEEDFLHFFDSIDFQASVTFEAGRNYWWIHELLSHHPNVVRVNVIDPRRSRKMAQELSTIKGYGRAKTDRIDSEMMAEQDRRGLAPTIHVPTEEQLIAKTLTRHRMDLIVQRTRIINKTHAILSMHGIAIDMNELIENMNSRQIVYSRLPDYVRTIVESNINLIVQLKNQLVEFEKILEKVISGSHPQIQLIKTAPGFGDVLARVVYTEICDIDRFKSQRHLISYSGLAPMEVESAGKKGVVRLNRYCNYYLKYAFVEAAHHARSHPKYRRKYEMDVKKHGKVRAKLILARKLSKAIYWMLIRQQQFHD